MGAPVFERSSSGSGGGSGSGLPSNVLTKTANFPAADGDFILADATGGAFTITLPTGANVGAAVIVKKIDASANAIAVAGTIDGDAGGVSIAVQNFGAIFEHVGSNAWKIVGITASSADGRGLPLALTGAVSATRYVGATASVAPTTGTFAVGDFVITQNAKIFICTVAGSPGTWVQVGSGTGDVVGPASAVSGDVATFNGTTGKLVQDSGVLIGSARVTAPGGIRINSGSFLSLDVADTLAFIILAAGIGTFTGALSARGGFRVQEAANTKQGVATLVGGTVTVSNTSVTANSRIFLTAQTLGTVVVPSALGVSARSVGASFTVLASQPTDTSIVSYEIFEPGN